MTQEEKQLLLKDLSARLPYGVKIFVPVFNHIETLEGLENFDEQIIINGNVSNIKPYLRRMSSMTEEEKHELYHDCYILSVDYDRRTTDMVALPNISRVTDWLNQHHFDYRGLIEKGLAISVTENNNPYKE